MGALRSDKCHNGHYLTGSNIYERKNGQRECRACSLARAAAKRLADGITPRRGPDCDFEVPAKELKV